MAAVRASRVAQRAGCSARVALRAFSTKGDATMSTADIMKTFLELDSAATKATKLDLPIKLTGRSGELVEGLFVAAGKDSKKFEGIVKQLEGFVAAIESAGLVVDRFFATTNYSADECKAVLELLTSEKEPLKSFDGIKDAEVREVIVDNEGNLDVWRNARKAVSALGLSSEVKTALEAIAADGRLDLAKKLASKAAALKAITSKTLDATVVSAVALTKDQQASVSKALPSYAPAGQTVNVEFVVDPAVLGGLMVTLANTTIDLTVTSKMVDVMTAARSAKQLA